MIWAIPVFAVEPTKEIERWHDTFVSEKYVPYVRESYDPRSCVSYAKWLLGVPQEVIWGNANQIKPLTDKPFVGALVITKEGKYGHVAVVKEVYDDRIVVDEANYIPGKIGTRTIYSFDLIVGYR